MRHGMISSIRKVLNGRCRISLRFRFFLTQTTPTQIYTLSLHDALPISGPMYSLSGSPSASRRWSGIGSRLAEDRKSTRLNSSHANISYAVFCLKKKKPTGNSKYDSFQIKATKRFSHNLQGSGAFTWGQGFNHASRHDFFNPESAEWALQNFPPLSFFFNSNDTHPNLHSFPTRRSSDLRPDVQLERLAISQSALVRHREPTG